MRTIGRILLTTLAVLAAWYFFPDEISLSDWSIAIIVAIAIALLNTFIKPLFIILTIPVTIFTFGLFLLAVNAIMIMFADWLIDDFHVKNFWWALVLSLIISLINSIAQKDDQERNGQRRNHPNFN